MTFRLFGAHTSTRQGKRKPSLRPAPDKRIEAERPVRVYSLLLPPTLPRDRR
jgi:hypothetical protein